MLLALVTQLHGCYGRPMCRQCNYSEMLSKNGVEPTPLRKAVFRFIGHKSKPVSAIEILETVRKQVILNKVTVYRILDLLVEKRLIKRLYAGDRALRYGMGESARHPEHAHFVCRQCGRMECLAPEAFRLDIKELRARTQHTVENVDVRFEGTCASCLDSR